MGEDRLSVWLVNIIDWISKFYFFFILFLHILLNRCLMIIKIHFIHLAPASVVAHHEASQIRVVFVGHAMNPAKHVQAPVRILV